MAAFEWLQEQTELRGDVLTWTQLARGFPFGGDRIPLVSPQGIFKPRQLAVPLSIRTAPDGPYDDAFGPDGLLMYPVR